MISFSGLAVDSFSDDDDDDDDDDGDDEDAALGEEKAANWNLPCRR